MQFIQTKCIPIFSGSLNYFFLLFLTHIRKHNNYWNPRIIIFWWVSYHIRFFILMRVDVPQAINKDIIICFFWNRDFFLFSFNKKIFDLNYTAELCKPAVLSTSAGGPAWVIAMWDRNVIVFVGGCECGCGQI